jgi:hypothetical protein
MEVRGTVVSFEDNVQVAKNGGGSYPGARFSYRDDTGALKEKGFHNNVFKFNGSLKAQLVNLKSGEPFVMVMEKEKDFWNVKSIQPDTGSTNASNSSSKGPTGASPTPTYTSPKSTYETPEERAQKQVYIVRQSSINQALEYTAQIKDFFKGTDKPIEEIINIAKQFEAHVYGKEFDSGMPMDMDNDLDGIM